MAQNPNLAALSAAGVSVWLDDLSRDRLQTGNLQELIDTKSVVGVTTNPSIFQAALSAGTAYDEQVKELADRGADVDATIRTVTTDDVRNACDVLAKQYELSGGVDGRVSIEVDPTIAGDTDATTQQALELHAAIEKPNLYVKIPATKAGLPAIEDMIAAGHSINVTLIFSLEMSKFELMERMLAGEARIDSSKIKRGFLEYADWKNKIHPASGRLAAAPILIDDSSAISIMEIRAKARRFRLTRSRGFFLANACFGFARPRGVFFFFANARRFARPPRFLFARSRRFLFARPRRFSFTRPRRFLANLRGFLFADPLDFQSAGARGIVFTSLHRAVVALARRLAAQLAG